MTIHGKHGMKKHKSTHIHHEPRMVCYEDDAAPKSNPKSSHYAKKSKKKEKGYAT